MRTLKDITERVLSDFDDEQSAALFDAINLHSTNISHALRQMVAECDHRVYIKVFQGLESIVLKVEECPFCRRIGEFLSEPQASTTSKNHAGVSFVAINEGGDSGRTG